MNNLNRNRVAVNTELLYLEQRSKDFRLMPISMCFWIVRAVAVKAEPKNLLTFIDAIFFSLQEMSTAQSNT